MGVAAGPVGKRARRAGGGGGGRGGKGPGGGGGGGGGGGVVTSRSVPQLWRDLQPRWHPRNRWWAYSWGRPWWQAFCHDPFPAHRKDTMPVLQTQLNARSADFLANAAAMRSLVEDLNAQITK